LFYCLFFVSDDLSRSLRMMEHVPRAEASHLLR
jgi:hypothetical protein